MSLALAGPSFPPLLDGRVAAGDPFEEAVAAAKAGCDAGLVLYDAVSDDLSAAMVLAPDVPLDDAAAMLPLAGIALQNALGAIGPSELPVHLEWSGAIRVNGARCGAVRIAASIADPGQVPDWLIVGLTVRFAAGAADGGQTPDDTALHAEGCGELSPLDLLEAWARHSLSWIHRWEEDGIAPLHREWTGLAYGLGQPVTMRGEAGTFLGLDERLGMLFKSGGTTHLIPLTELVETR